MRLNGQKLDIQKNQVKNAQIREEEKKGGDEERGEGETQVHPYHPCKWSVLRDKLQ